MLGVAVNLLFTHVDEAVRFPPVLSLGIYFLINSGRSVGVPPLINTLSNLYPFPESTSALIDGEGEADKGLGLFTRCGLPFSSPQFIQHPLFFILSFINHTVNKNMPAKIAGITRTASVIGCPMTSQSNHRIPVTQTARIPWKGRLE